MAVQSKSVAIAKYGHFSCRPRWIGEKNAQEIDFFFTQKIMFKNIKKNLDIYFSLCLSKTVIEMKVAHIIYLDLNVRTDRTQAQLEFQSIRIYTKRS